MRPSRSCGPFRLQYSPNNEFSVLYEITNQLRISLPKDVSFYIEFIFSTFILTIVALIMM